MAPQGSTRSQTLQAGRSSRNSPSLGTNTRGGIRKRRGAPGGRTDSDGDLDMDATRRSGNKPFDSAQPARGTRNTRSRGGSQAAQAIARHLRGGTGSLSTRALTPADRRTPRGSSLTWLRVRGLKESKAANNEGGGLRDLLVFLERKASKSDKVTIRKSRISGDFVFVAASADHAAEILKLNGFTFAGTSLEVTTYDEAAPASTETSSAAQELKDALKSVLSTHYDGNLKLLSLKSLAQDPILVSLGAFTSRDTAEKTFRALMKICDDLFKTSKEKQEAIQSISLADNNIDNVIQVDSVADTFPDLKNLDLSGNSLGSMAGLSKWKGKFRQLEMIQIVGNPLVASEPNYGIALLEMFPKLQYVDGIHARTAEQIAEIAAARAAARAPKPFPQHGPDFRDMNGIGEAFLVDFFTTYDSDRQALLAKYYDDDSAFSLSVDTNSVRHADAPPPMPWGAYIKYSRNLKKITTVNARIQRLLQGRNLILELWKDLPKTHHPNIKVETSKYVMDCHSLSGLRDPTNQSPGGVDGMIISVHGEFDEQDKDGKTGKRSFSRTFVLGPGLPGGNAIRVVSDMLCLRANNPLPNIFEQAPAASASAAVAPAVADANPQAQQQAMVIELCRQTGMTQEYSTLCLEQSGWNFDQALVLYNEKKSSLPAEAWVVPPAA